MSSRLSEAHGGISLDENKETEATDFRFSILIFGEQINVTVIFTYDIFPWIANIVKLTPYPCTIQIKAVPLQPTNIINILNLVRMRKNKQESVN